MACGQARFAVALACEDRDVTGVGRRRDLSPQHGHLHLKEQREQFHVARPIRASPAAGAHLSWARQSALAASDRATSLVRSQPVRCAGGCSSPRQFASEIALRPAPARVAAGPPAARPQRRLGGIRVHNIEPTRPGVRVRHLRVLTKHAEVGRELPATAPIQRIEERAPHERRLCLGRVGERRLHGAQQHISEAARGDRRGGGLELPDSERLLREPGQGITLAGGDPVVLGRVPGRHVRELIDRTALGAELRRIVARRARYSPVEAPGGMSAGGHQRVQVIGRAVILRAGLGSHDRWRAPGRWRPCRAARGGVPPCEKRGVIFWGNLWSLRRGTLCKEHGRPLQSGP